MSELFGLKWKDVDFDANEISVVRSIVMQVTGPCKTEASQKPIALDPHLGETLLAWRQHVRYNRSEDWVFANPRIKGRQPYWGTSNHAQSHTAYRDSSGYHEAYRLAYPCCLNRNGGFE
jgi:integrase